jgi:7,8-dihydro-6-hydroxymethylpterin-pyrophosphokinase
VIEAYVGLGSNLGDRLGNLGAAVDKLAREPGFTLRRVSLAYESPSARRSPTT